MTVCSIRIGRAGHKAPHSMAMHFAAWNPPTCVGMYEERFSNLVEA